MDYNEFAPARPYEDRAAFLRAVRAGRSVPLINKKDGEFVTEDGDYIVHGPSNYHWPKACYAKVVNGLVDEASARKW